MGVAVVTTLLQGWHGRAPTGGREYLCHQHQMLTVPAAPGPVHVDTNQVCWSQAFCTGRGTVVTREQLLRGALAVADASSGREVAI
jgi:hypothetical protein